jgi:hypothetical protein
MILLTKYIDRIINPNKKIKREDMREKKYIEFYENVAYPGVKNCYIKNVKYRIIDETEENYVLSRKRNLVSKSKEGKLYTTGKI